MRRLIVGLLLALLLAPAAARAQSEEVVYYHTDAIGSVRMITDANGDVVARYDFLPFGVRWGVAPPAADARMFAGKERDPETELDYFGARYYSDQVGRFTTVDPVMNVEAALTDPQRWNRYSYAVNNPLKFVDPDGRDPRLVGGAIGTVVFTAYNAYVNVQQGQPWYRNVGIEASKGFLFGISLGLVTPALTGTALELGALSSTASSSSAYDIAAAGGKHSGFLSNYAQKSTRELNRAVASFEREIATHLDKIKNPAKHIEDFNKLDPRRQKDLLEQKWPGDVSRLREQRDILKRLLEERF